MLHVSYAYVVCIINTNVYDIREIIKYAGACTLNKLEIKFEICYEHAAVRWYMLSYSKGVPKFCTCIQIFSPCRRIAYTLDISLMYATCKLCIS